jgi:PhzF family phenazine biosynthesis protein
MQADFFQIAAFARTAFAGNPAGVVFLDRWLDDALLQSIAAEANVSATAFVVTGAAGYQLRWFTPTLEETICGHGTLAAAWALFHRRGIGHDKPSLTFQTRSGPLEVERSADGRLGIDMPARPVVPVADAPGVADALGCKPREILADRYYLAVLHSADAVRHLKPDISAIARLDKPWVVVTAEGDGEYDCVSRYFGPGNGIPEDSATGSAHCMITPYWAARSGRTRFHAYQASARGGVIDCDVKGDRVIVSGHCVPFLEGSILIPD